MRIHRIVKMVILLAVVVFQAGQGQVSLSGRVLSKKGEILSGATIILMSQDTIVAGGLSDKKGYFQLQGLAVGSYKFAVSMVGFEAVEDSVQLNQSFSLGVILLSEDVQKLDEVVVEADRRNVITHQAGASTFRLSGQAMKSGNVYEALREIPKLLVNETNRSIQMTNGVTPLVLVNGVNRPGFIESLSPEEIESVEVIENPSARYRGDQSVRAILNIKTRPKKENSYLNGNVYSKHHAAGVFGVSGLSTEMGNSKYSVYLNAQHFYFHNDDGDLTNKIESDSYSRLLSGERRYKSNMVYANLGGDWYFDGNNYWAFSATLTTNPQQTVQSLEGTHQDFISGETPSPLTIRQHTDNRYLNNTYSLFYRHTFANENHLEWTGTFGYFTSGAKGDRTETDGETSRLSRTDLDNGMQNGRLEANYDGTITDKILLEAGSNTYFRHTSIKDRIDSNGSFSHKEWTEYLYASVLNKPQGKFSYMLSAGLDMVFSDASGMKKHYLTFAPSASVGYTSNQQSNWQLSYSRNRTSPSASYLNPRNTSLDSLVVRVGNPGLRPAIDNLLQLNYSWNHAGIYLQPFLVYDYITDQLEEVGYSDGQIFTYIYENLGKAHQFQAGISTRFNLSKYGNLNFTTYYQKYKMTDCPYNGNSIHVNGNLFLFYKKVSLNLFAYYTNYSYTQNTKVRSTPESELMFTWNLPKQWALNLGLKYFAAKDNRTEVWTEQVSYRQYSLTKMSDRYLMPLIGLTYRFNNKTPYKWRQKKMLPQTESGVSDIKVQ